MATDWSSTEGRNNTLNLSAERLSMLMDELDQMNEGPKIRRHHARLEYRKHAIEMEVYQFSGGSVGFCVACRNISRGGLSVLHSSYMHIGTKCRVKMRHKTHGDQWLMAEVAQCRHVTGRVHDVGLRFKREIDINDYVRLDPLNETFSLEHVDPDKLQGRVLLVTASDIDRKLIEVYLSETMLRIVSVSSYEEMLPKLVDPYDAVICDFDMDSKVAAQSLKSLRMAGHSLPIIAVSGDTSVSARDTIRDARASAFIPKPIERLPLLRALAEFIILHRSGGEADVPNQVKSETDPALRGLADLFIQDLQKFATELAECIEKKDEKKLRYICARIRGTGPLLGYGAEADTASKILKILDHQGSMDGATELINALVGLCRHAKSSAA